MADWIWDRRSSKGRRENFSEASSNGSVGHAWICGFSRGGILCRQMRGVYECFSGLSALSSRLDLLRYISVRYFAEGKKLGCGTNGGKYGRIVEYA